MKNNVPLWCSCAMLRSEKYTRFKKKKKIPIKEREFPSLDVRVFRMALLYP